MPTFSNELDDGYIWLEGAEVSKNIYNKLYKVYGDIYGTPVSSENFVLPDCRNKSIWGSSDGTFGYLDPTLPNITGKPDYGIVTSYDGSSTSSGVCKDTTYGRGTRVNFNGSSGGLIALDFNAHNSNPIYQDGATVRPPSFKVRWKTRYR